MEPEFVFETILFIHGLPSYYKVYCLNGYFIYEPTPHHFYSSITFPELVAIKLNDAWNVYGSTDKQLIHPLISELESHLPVKASGEELRASS